MKVKKKREEGGREGRKKMNIFMHGVRAEPRSRIATLQRAPAAAAFAGDFQNNGEAKQRKRERAGVNVCFPRPVNNYHVAAAR